MRSSPPAASDQYESAAVVSSELRTLRRTWRVTVTTKPASQSNSAERSLRARLAAHTLHSQVDGKQHTAAARAGFLRRFEDLVDSDRILSAGERERRARHALKAHMTGLALRSAQARRSPK